MVKKSPSPKNWPISREKLRDIASKPLPVSFDALIGGLLQVDPAQMPRPKKKAAKKPS